MIHDTTTTRPRVRRFQRDRRASLRPASYPPFSPPLRPICCLTMRGLPLPSCASWSWSHSPLAWSWSQWASPFSARPFAFCIPPKHITSHNTNFQLPSTPGMPCADAFSCHNSKTYTISIVRPVVYYSFQSTASDLCVGLFGLGGGLVLLLDRRGTGWGGRRCNGKTATT